MAKQEIGGPPPKPEGRTPSEEANYLAGLRLEFIRRGLAERFGFWHAALKMEYGDEDPRTSALMVLAEIIELRLMR